MRYSIEVIIGCACGGFERKTNHIKDVRETVREYGLTKNKVTVYDNVKNDFIYWKSAFSDPMVNLL